MRADRYCGFGPWTQHGLYSIDTALGELIIVVYVVLKLLTLLFTTPMINFIFDIYWYVPANNAYIHLLQIIIYMRYIASLTSKHNERHATTKHAT